VDLAARRRIVAAAEWLQGVPYDESHSDGSWRNLYAPPALLDCSTFVVRVACEALGYDVGMLAPDAKWLLKNLAYVKGAGPEPGDIVGYHRNATPAEQELVAGPRVWHVMIFVGSGTVVGACDLAGVVVKRPIAYEEHWRGRRWIRRATQRSPLAPYRRLELRTV
jgi:cell wall-associated NlpC family hydrolase